MYDSNNLPLSSLKPIKKSLPGIITIIIFWIGYFLLRRLFISTVTDAGPITEATTTGIIWMNWTVNLGALFLIVGICIFEYLYYKFYYYSFEENNAEIKKGVVSVATGHVRYERLQNIYVDQDVLDRMFGLYDVHYETAGETSGFYSHVDGLNKINSDKLVEFLNNRIANPENGPSHPENIQQQTTVTQEPQKNQDNTTTVDISRENCPISSILIFTGTLRMSILFIIIILAVLGGILPRGYAIPEPANFNLIFFLFIFIVVAGSLMINFIWYKNFYFYFGKDKAEIRTKVIGQSSSFLYYNRIQNVNVRQGITDRLFGLYSLSIETAGEKSSVALNIPGLSQINADKLRDYLIAKSQRYQASL
ncbi:MAG: PH domain-containing protein [Patescibacteria group bacterium]|nr:PH domain-containing protein [Patescibacteria group bacterium]